MQQLQGKVALITGATNGIGLETARALARRGATSVIVGRNMEKTSAVVQQIRDDTGNQDVHFFVADLSLQDQVHRLARHFREHFNRLDILMNNAGGVFGKRQVTAEGFEMTWALNHLSYFSLSNLLLDLLKASGAARIVNTASEAHRNGPIKWDDLQFERGYNDWLAYCQSKAANILFTRELARRLEGSDVTANAVHPGFVRTGFSTGSGLGAFGHLMELGALSPEEGAQTSIHVASAPETAGMSGLYWSKCRAIEPHRRVQSDEDAARLWEVSREMTGVG